LREAFAGNVNKNGCFVDIAMIDMISLTFHSNIPKPRSGKILPAQGKLTTQVVN